MTGSVKKPGGALCVLRSTRISTAAQTSTGHTRSKPGPQQPAWQTVGAAEANRFFPFRVEMDPVLEAGRLLLVEAEAAAEP